MLPLRKKVDISSLSPEERKLFEKYGKLPTHKNTLMKMQKERKYFDSGDYALSKAGRAPPTTVGTAIPNPENIPHTTAPGAGHNGHQGISVSPTSSSAVIKESSLAHENEEMKPPESSQEDEEIKASGPAGDDTKVPESASDEMEQKPSD